MIGVLVKNVLGKRLAWRIGRAIYMEARGEIVNDIASNGEAALVRAVVAASGSQPVTIWDVGGNLGDWSQAAVDAAQQSGAELILEVFEPVPAASQHIETRFAKNSSVRVHKFALAAEAGKGRMEIVAPTGGTNALVADDAKAAGTIDVVIDTADAVRMRLAQDEIQLIKIDAEGHDLAILKGMAATLGAGKAEIVQFEYNHRWIATGSSLYQVFRLIEGLPYALARVTPKGLEILPEWNAEADRYFECNYALVRTDMIAKIGARTTRWDASNVLIDAS